MLTVQISRALTCFSAIVETLSPLKPQRVSIPILTPRARIGIRTDIDPQETYLVATRASRLQAHVEVDAIRCEVEALLKTAEK